MAVRAFLVWEAHCRAREVKEAGNHASLTDWYLNPVYSFAMMMEVQVHQQHTQSQFPPGTILLEDSMTTSFRFCLHFVNLDERCRTGLWDKILA